MKEVLKRKQVRIYLDPKDAARLSALITAVGVMSETQLMGALLTSALKACEALGNRVPLPLHFEVCDEAPVPKARSVTPTPLRK